VSETTPLILKVPTLSLVLLIGPSGSGKSTFARKHFRATEVVSSDHCRALICDDEDNQSVTGDAFALLHGIVGRRLHWGRLTVVDATNVQAYARRSLRAVARRHRIPTVAIAFKAPARLIAEWNRARPQRQVADDVIRQQRADFRHALQSLPREQHHAIYILNGPADIDRAVIMRV
jgi:protein phosphatase